MIPGVAAWQAVAAEETPSCPTLLSNWRNSGPRMRAQLVSDRCRPALSASTLRTVTSARAVGATRLPYKDGRESPPIDGLESRSNDSRQVARLPIRCVCLLNLSFLAGSPGLDFRVAACSLGSHPIPFWDCHKAWVFRFRSSQSCARAGVHRPPHTRRGNQTLGNIASCAALSRCGRRASAVSWSARRRPGKIQAQRPATAT